MDEIARQVPLVFPVHPRTRERLSQSRIKYRPTLRLIQPMEYLNFLSLFSTATLVLSGSRGIREETTVLLGPCLTLRGNTERPVTISQGTNVRAGTSPSKIVSAAQRVLRGENDGGRTQPV